MNVGLVIERFDPRRGGVEQWTWQFARRLAARGDEVHVVAREFAAEADSPWIAHRVEAGSRAGFAVAAERALQRLQLDVIHDTGCGWHCDVFQPHGGSRRASFERNLALSPAWLRPLKRGLTRVAPRYREFERLLARQYVDDGRVFLAISRMVRDDMFRWHGVRPDAIRLVYNGVDTEKFSPAHRATWRAALRSQWGVADDEVVLLIVAHNFRLKGVATLLRAAGRLRSDGARVRVVVAGGKRGGPYERLARRSGVAASFLGPVDNVAACYAAADVYVQPTFYDPCSLVVLEALAAGLPVVTSRYNGAGELLTAAEGMIIADPADDAELAAAVRPYLETSFRERAGERARALALRHTLDRNCDEIRAVYHEIVDRRQARAA